MDGFYDSRVVLALPAFVTGYGLYKLLRFVYNDRTSPLRLLPGPDSPSFIFGNMKEVMSGVCLLLFVLEQYDVHTNVYVYRKPERCNRYGPSSMDRPSHTKDSWECVTFASIQDHFHYHVGDIVHNLNTHPCTQRTQLFTIDTKAVQHVLTHYLSYPKPEMVRYRLSMLMGNGLVLVEGDRHREQRRIMVSFFLYFDIYEVEADCFPTRMCLESSIFRSSHSGNDTYIHSKIITGQSCRETFLVLLYENISKARDVLLGEIEKGGGKAQMEAMSWLSKVTLDIIGLAG